MTRARQLLKWLGLTAAGLLLLPALAAGLGYGYLQSDGGRDWAARTIERLISTPGEVEVRIGRLTGQIPFDVSVSDLRVSDPAGVWLIVEGLGYQVDPAALLQSSLRFRLLQADRVRLDRLPEPAAPDPAASETAGWSTLPFSVRIERLDLREVALGPAVLGAAAAFRVEGEARSRDGSDVDASVSLERTDGQAGSAQAMLRYAFAESDLEVDAQVEEPAGGMVVRALGLETLPALAARLTGRGPLSDWAGTLSVTLENLAEARAELRLQSAQDTAFSVDGSLDSLADFDDLPWRLIKGHVDITAEGRWQEPETLVLERGRITGPALDFSLSGSLDLAGETLQAQAAVQVPEPLDFRPYLPGAAVTGLGLTATARGGFDAPEIAAEITAATLTLDDLTISDLAAHATSQGPLSRPRLAVDVQAGGVTSPDVTAGDVASILAFEPAADFGPERLRGKVSTSGTAGRLDLAALTDWAPAIGRRLAWTLDAEVDGEAGRLQETSFSLETERGRLTGDGSFAWESGATDARLRLAYSDLAAIGPLLGLDLGGRLQAAAEVTSAGPLGVLDAEVSGALADLVWPDSFAQALAAPTVDFSGTVGLKETGALSLTGLRLASPAAEVAGDLDLGPDLSRISARYRARLADLAALSEIVGQPLSGSAVVTGRADGRFEAMSLSASLEVPKGSVASVPVEALRVEVTAAELPERPGGSLHAAFRSSAGDVTARSTYSLNEDALDLATLSLAADGLEADGQARVPLSGAPLTLGLDGRAETLSHWLALAGLDGDGRGTFRLALSPDGDRQAGRVEAKLKDVRLDLGPDGNRQAERLTAAELSATFESADLLGPIGGEVRLAVGGLQLSELTLASLDVSASGDLAGADVRASAAGDWRGDLTLDAAGRVAVQGERVEVEVSRLAGRVLDEELALERPVEVTVDGTSVEVSNLDLGYGEARLRGAGRRAPDSLAADITVQGLPLTALRPVADLPIDAGRGEARLQLSGTAAAPLGEVTVALRQVRIADLSEVPAFDVEFQGRWRDGVLASTGRLAGLTDEDVALSLDLPLRLDPATLIPDVPADGPVAGKLDWQGPIAPLWALVPADLHELSGQGDIHAALAGTVGAPKLSGGFALRQGRYESLEAGTLLKNLELAGDLADTRIELTRLRADDGGSGSLEASGVVELDPGRGFNSDIKATFEKFALLRRDDISAVARGDLQVTGSPERTLVEGRIVTDSVEVHIPDRMPPDVVDLAVVEEGAAAEAEELAVPEDGATAESGHITAFDLTIDIPRRAFIRGRGIDSEWAGRLKLSGAGDKVAIKGSLDLVRGRVSALGKNFQLDRGSVTFLGNPDNDPDLNIVARREGQDLDVVISVTGRLSNPTIAFASVPELPQDEVISQLLFGKSTSQLSAVEAAQLAASVAEMTGQAGGANSLLGRVRNTLGVDVLRLESDASGDSTSPSVAAGKYLGDDVYVGAKQGTDTDSGAAEVEVELTPNVSVQSEVGQQGDSKVGVKFKWDY